MSDGKTDPPRGAIWFLQNACPGDNEALTGDLIVRFREGRTHAWFWRQVLIAFAVGVLGEIRRHGPHFCYANRWNGNAGRRAMEDRGPISLKRVAPAVAVVTTSLRPSRNLSTCFGFIACAGSWAGDQRIVSLG